MRKQQKAITMYKIVHDLAPWYLTVILTKQNGLQIYVNRLEARLLRRTDITCIFSYM